MTEILDTIREVSGPLTVNRTTEETVVRGHVIPGTTAVLGIEGHMQPLNSVELRLVPEGMNTLEWHHVWALTEIKEDDLISDGTTPVIKIMNVDPWKEAPFWHAQGVKVIDTLVRLTAYEVVGFPELAKVVPAAVGTFGP